MQCENDKEQCTDEIVTALVDMEWLPEDLLRQLEGQNDPDLRNAMAIVDRAVNRQNQDMESTDVIPVTRNNNPLEQEENEVELQISAIINDIENSENNANVTLQSPLTVCEELVTDIKIALSKNGEKWKTMTIDQYKLILKSEEKLSVLTHAEINYVYEVLLPRLSSAETQVPIMRRSWKKERKLKLLNFLMGNSELPTDYCEKRRTKIISPGSLRQMALKVLKSRVIPKDVLAVAYAQYVFPEKVKEWQDKSTIDPNVKIEGFENDVPFWYSHPEYNSHSNSLLAKGIDCSHNFTHLRVRTSTTGICGISPGAWKACAESNETKLKVSLVNDLLDKQSVPNARTHFSTEVETWIRKNGYIETADLVLLIRNWYDANDLPGISSQERVKRLLAMRHFLLSDINFNIFPPKTRYFKQIPVVTYEGLLMDIDTKLQMYAISGTYNIRSVGSLAAETAVGILQSLNPASQVSIKAVDVPSLLASTVSVMTYKMNPNRGFHMRTARRSGIYPEHEGSVKESNGEQSTSNNNVNRIDTNIVVRDHFFDKPERKLVSRKIKFGTVSDPSAPARGALPVRQWHRRDESKILATKRLGIDDTFGHSCMD